MRFHTKLEHGSFSSATLVLRRNPEFLTKRLLRKHRLLAVRIFGIPHRQSPLVGHPRVIEINKHWIKVDITSILKSKRDNNMMTNVSIEVTCKECQSGKSFVNSKKRRPFLIFNIKPAANMRKRRSTQCPTSSCCLKDLMLDFDKVFGAKNFVRFPTRINIKYCKGPCSSHGSTILLLNRLNILPPTKKTNPNDQCCVVSRMKSLSILYDDQQKLIHKKDLPNLIAEECQCQS